MQDLFILKYINISQQKRQRQNNEDFSYKTDPIKYFVRALEEPETCKNPACEQQACNPDCDEPVI